MGYTGAAVYDVTVDMSRLFIKHVVLKPGPKLVRDKKSYVCDAYCLANLRDVNVPKLHASYAQGDVVISIMASLNDTHSTSPPTGMEYGEVRAKRRRGCCASTNPHVAFEGEGAARVLRDPNSAAIN